jgi:RNA polymerase sigma-70 factor, ECF subfamily
VSDEEATAAMVSAARAGDGGAMDRLFRRFAPVVHGVLLARVPRADADDLTQDVFETALTRLHELREDAAFPGWIVRIARREAADAHRRGRVAPGDGDALDHVGVHGDAETRLDAGRALCAIRGLPEAYRETLLLRLVEGLTGPEISRRTGLTPGSVRVNLHRGMAMLREALAIHTGGGGP